MHRKLEVYPVNPREMVFGVFLCIIVKTVIIPTSLLYSTMFTVVEFLIMGVHRDNLIQLNL